VNCIALPKKVLKVGSVKPERFFRLPEKLGWAVV
jgi:hypothetical protein